VEGFVEGVTRELVDGILEDVVVRVTEEVACEVCIEEDALDIGKLRRRDLV
jgi:propanediol utilization protein